MISGSYSPGSIYFFRGLGKGEYAPATKLVRTDGRRVNTGNASAVAVADWNRDGRLDLVIGNIDGEVWFVPNESQHGQLVFGERHQLLDRGHEIRVTGDAGPSVADWDTDGIPDLLLGASDGSVTYYRGSGKEGAPTLAEAEILVPPLPEDMGNAIEIRCEVDPATGHLRMPNLSRPWIRTKPAVADWNGDGKPDLLVGDLVGTRGPEPKLTDAKKKERDEIDGKAKKIREEASQAYSNAYTRARGQAKKEMESRGKSSDDANYGEELEERTGDIASKDPRYLELCAQREEIYAELNAFRAEYSAHGFVWVYLRTEMGRGPVARR